MIVFLFLITAIDLKYQKLT